MESLLLTVAKTAALLRVSVDTIKRQITAGIIPVKRIRTSVRVSRKWVDAFAAESAPVLLSRRQVSAKLGVSTLSVRTLQRKGLLPTVKIGRMQRIPALAVAEYVKRNSFGFLRAKGSAPAARLAPRPAVVAPVRSSALGFQSVRGV